MRKFIEERNVDSIPHIGDESGELWGDFGVRGQPAWVIIPGDGSDPSLVFGALGESNFAQYVNS